MKSVQLAVNGTLMLGLELNKNLLGIGATFVKEATTAPTYKLWSINDVHPAMQRVADGGAAIALEIWEVPISGVATILLQEPPGLVVGKIQLGDGAFVLGVLGEAYACEDQKEITEFGGWRRYRLARQNDTL